MTPSYHTNPDLPPGVPELGKVGQRGHEATPDRGGDGGDGGRGGRGAKGFTGDTGPPGRARYQSKADKIALFVIVALSAAGLYYYGDQARDDINANRKLVSCQRVLLADTIYALKARSSFAETQAEAALVLERAQAKYLRTVADPGINSAQAYAALAEYREALSFNIAAISDILTVRQRNPYPKDSRIVEC